MYKLTIAVSVFQRNVLSSLFSVYKLVVTIATSVSHVHTP